MNSLKTLVVLTVLGGVGYGVYVSLHKKPLETPPANSAIGPTKMEPGGSFAQNGGLLSAAKMAADEKSKYSAAAVRLPETGTVPPDAQNPFASHLASTIPTTNGGMTINIPPRDPGLPPLSRSNTPQASYNSEAAHPNTPSSAFTTVWKAAQEQLSQNKLAEAHLTLSMIYDEPLLTDSEQRQLRDLLDQLAGTVIYSTQNLLEPAYIVKPGDRLENIAANYQVPAPLLAKINGIENPDLLQPGEQLKVLHGPFNATINIDRRELTLFVGGRYAGRFFIGVGRDVPLAQTTYWVKEKTVNPKYLGSNGQQIEAGDPANPLGARWIGLGGLAGIHGTNDPRNIGRDDLRGCISMSQKDVADVYDILSEGSKVVVRH
ncbi:MAG TPA: L,D-transpeptidase family protein [Pirellulales bacterium]|nr:L,D-transpeptidase family protein [Pirellulales bacterium]